MLISIIVPVYNKEKHLSKCLNSIINQLDDDCELIAINDGSTDSSLEILRSYLKYKNVRVYTQQNLGVSITTNLLVSYAVGEYIINIDSDDWVADDLIIKVKSAIVSFNNPDIIQFFSKAYNDKNELLYFHECRTFNIDFDRDRINILKKFDEYYFLTHTGKAIKKGIFNKVKFNGKAAGADTIAFLKILSLSHSFVSIPHFLYFVNVLETSESRNIDTNFLNELMIDRYILFLSSTHLYSNDVFYIIYFFVFKNYEKYLYLSSAPKQKITILKQKLMRCIFNGKIKSIKVKLYCFPLLCFPFCHKCLLKIYFKVSKKKQRLNQ